MSGHGDINMEESGEDDVFKRLMQLKAMYKMQQQELTGEPVSKTNSSRSGSSDNDSTSQKKPQQLQQPQQQQSPPQQQQPQQPQQPQPAPPSQQSRKKSVPELPQLQNLITEIIEENGGSCHFDTVVEFVNMRNDHDSEQKAVQDYKKAVHAALRNKASIFIKDEEREGYWSLAKDAEEAEIWRSDDERDEDDNDIEHTPLSDTIAHSIEGRGGSCHLEDIYEYSLENWIRPHIAHGKNKLSDEKVKEAIRTTLRTDPRFARDTNPSNADFFMLVDKKFVPPPPQRTNRRVSRSAAGRSTPKAVTPKIEEPAPLPEVRSRRAPSRRSAATTPSSASAAPPPRGSSPPPGYKCPCGATEPGRGPTCKWRKGPKGEFLCNSCGLQWSKKHACPVCGKVYRRNEAASDENSWIRCDDCHRWVMTKCDGIEDLSLYDDDNPNHLHYSCPLCRGYFGKEKAESEPSSASEHMNTSQEGATPNKDNNIVNNNNSVSKRRVQKRKIDVTNNNGADVLTPDASAGEVKIEKEDAGAPQATTAAASTIQRKPGKRKRLFTTRSRRKTTRTATGDVNDEADGGDDNPDAQDDGVSPSPISPTPQSSTPATPIPTQPSDSASMPTPPTNQLTPVASPLPQTPSQVPSQPPQQPPPQPQQQPPQLQQQLQQQPQQPPQQPNSLAVKLDTMESDIINKLSQVPNTVEDGGQNFVDEVRSFKSALLSTKESILRKQAQEYELKVENFRNEKEVVDQQAEETLNKQLREFYVRNKEKLDGDVKKVWEDVADDDKMIV